MNTQINSADLAGAEAQDTPAVMDALGAAAKAAAAVLAIAPRAQKDLALQAAAKAPACRHARHSGSQRQGCCCDGRQRRCGFFH